MFHSIWRSVALDITFSPRTPVLDRNMDQPKTLIRDDIFTKDTSLFLLLTLKISEPETKPKTIGSENSKKTCFRLVSGLVKNPNLNRMYLQKYNEPRSEIWTQVISICLLYTI
jgi:hypothetical protein